MLKKSLLIIISLLIGHQLFSQKSNFGLRVGASKAWFVGSDYDKADSASSIGTLYKPTGGFYINVHVNDYFWLKTEFNYVNRAFSTHNKKFDKMLKNDFHYIDVYPVSPAFHFKGAQLFVGPAISVLITSVRDTINATTGEIKRISDSELEGYNRYDVGFVAGFEYEFNFGLNLGVRYTHGFTARYQPAAPSNIRNEWFNRGLYFTLGYSFGKK